MSTQRPRIVAVVGSLRDESYTRSALAHSIDAAQESGGEAELLDLRSFELPAFDPDQDEPADAIELQDRIGEADGILLGTPMYHGSYSSVLKTALDYCGFDEFEDSTVGLLGVAGGNFPISALDHLRLVCRALNAWVLPYQAAIPNAHRHFSNGELANDDFQARIATLGDRIVRFARITESDPPSFESEENVGAAN